MYSQNVKASEQIGILAQVSPQSTATSVTSGWVSAAEFNKFLATIVVGTFGASATVDANVQQATSSGGANAKAIVPAKALTQLLAAGGNNITATIDVDAAELDVANGFDFVQLTITVGTAASLVAGVLEGFNPRFATAASQNGTNVVQQVG